MKPFARLPRFLSLFTFAFSCSLTGRRDEGGKDRPKSFADFERSAVAGAAMPHGMPEPLQVMWFAKAGKWQAAHDIAETLKNPTGSWVHAFLHREEGDLVNAGYWYRRAGLTAPGQGVAIAEEWTFITRELWQRAYGVVAGEEARTSPGGLVALSVKSADGPEGSWDTLIQKDGGQILRISNARPVSFSPAGEVLLLVESATDDDCRHFLVLPSAAPAIPPLGQRRRIGGRYVTGHTWSEDGQSITLTSGAAADDAKPETLRTLEHLIPK